MINKIVGISSLLSDTEREQITSIIGGGRTSDYRRDIVSSDLDADKMDYLLRDAHFAGVRYGSFDLDKIIDVCRKYERGNESYLMIREEGIFAVEQLVLAKQYMTQQVYAHRVRTITDLMIVRGLELAIEDGHSEIKRLFSYDGSMEFLEFYLKFDDNRLMSEMMDERYQRSSEIFKRLQRRLLYKEVAEIRLDGSDVTDSIARGRLLNMSSGQAYELEKRIARMIGCEPWEVVVHKKSIKHPAYQEGGGLEPDAIHVMSSDGNSKTMGEFPDLISPRFPRTERIHVVAPMQFDSSLSRQARQEKADSTRGQIRGLIFDELDSGGSA